MYVTLYNGAYQLIIRQLYKLLVEEQENKGLRSNVKAVNFVYREPIFYLHLHHSLFHVALRLLVFYVLLFRQYR